MLISPPDLKPLSPETLVPATHAGDRAARRSGLPLRRHDTTIDGWRVAAISGAVLLHIIVVGWIALPDSRAATASRPPTLSVDDSHHDRLSVFVELQAAAGDLPLPPPAPPPPPAARLLAAPALPEPLHPVQDRIAAAIPQPAPLSLEPTIPGATASATEPAPVTATVAAGAAMTDAPVSAAQQRRERDAYVRALMAALLEHRSYPAAARKARDHGVVHVRFSIDRGGRVLATAVARSPGSPILDAAALEVLARASPLPPIPASMAQDTLTITVPIEYTLITR